MILCRVIDCDTGIETESERVQTLEEAFKWLSEKKTDMWNLDDAPERDDTEEEWLRLTVIMP